MVRSRTVRFHWVAVVAGKTLSGKDSKAVGRDLSLCCLKTNSQRGFVLILEQQNAKLILALEVVSISYCHPLLRLGLHLQRAQVGAQVSGSSLVPSTPRY